jgi:hypothetical protein
MYVSLSAYDRTRVGERATWPSRAPVRHQTSAVSRAPAARVRSVKRTGGIDAPGPACLRCIPKRRPCRGGYGESIKRRTEEALFAETWCVCATQKERDIRLFALHSCRAIAYTPKVKQGEREITLRRRSGCRACQGTPDKGDKITSSHFEHKGARTYIHTSIHTHTHAQIS